MFKTSQVKPLSSSQKYYDSGSIFGSTDITKHKQVLGTNRQKQSKKNLTSEVLARNNTET